MASDEHGDFKVRLEMEENGENLDFLQEIDEDFFIDEMVDPFSTINDAGASENSEKLIECINIFFRMEHRNVRL